MSKRSSAPESADASEDVGPEARDTAARICALMRHVFLYDRGNQLRVVEESGLSSTQCKALLELGGLGNCPSTWQVTDLAELFGASLPAMSRAVDGLVKKGLATRVEDPTDRRVRLVRITADGRGLVEQLTTVKRNGLEAFAVDPDRHPAPQARRRRRGPDGPRGHRQDVPTLERNCHGGCRLMSCRDVDPVTPLGGEDRADDGRRPSISKRSPTPTS